VLLAIQNRHRDAHRNFQQNEREGVGKGHVSQPIQHIPHLIGLGGLWGTRQGPMVSMMLCISTARAESRADHVMDQLLNNLDLSCEMDQSQVLINDFLTFTPIPLRHLGWTTAEAGHRYCEHMCKT